ncbi:MAG: hypothetical protein RLZ98_1005 [Pseudomonadota bacterium]
MQPAWMAEAWREYGQREIAGSNHNARIVALYRDAGHAGIRSDEVAWCAAFVGACLERAGYRCTRSLMARSYLGWGRATEKPRTGAVAVFTRGIDAAAGHVGFWIAENGSHILLLGGNQSDSVNLMWIEKSRLLGLRLPETGAGEVAESVFDTALRHVLEMEGGYTDDPYDPGGPTNLGITLATLAAHKGIAVSADTVGELKKQIKAISRETETEIYRSRYWRPSKAQDLPRPVALFHFDAAVNQGVGTAARMLQEAAGVDVDGSIGPLTRAAVWRADAHRLVETYAEIRRRRYRKLSHFWRFGRGWLNRVDKTLAAAKALKGDDEGPRSSSKTKQTTGDKHMDTQHSASSESGEKWWGESLTIWGSLITGLSTVLPVVAPLFGLNVTSELVVLLGEQVVQIAQAVGGLVGTLMVIQGRARASTRLVSKQVTLRL